MEGHSESLGHGAAGASVCTERLRREQVPSWTSGRLGRWRSCRNCRWRSCRSCPPSNPGGHLERMERRLGVHANGKWRDAGWRTTTRAGQLSEPAKHFALPCNHLTPSPHGVPEGHLNPLPSYPRPPTPLPMRTPLPSYPRLQDPRPPILKTRTARYSLQMSPLPKENPFPRKLKADPETPKSISLPASPRPPENLSTWPHFRIRYMCDLWI